MRFAIISDVHSNLEALREVLSDIDRCGVHTVISLGDNIGYGPAPEEVLKLLRLRRIPSIMGNHELGIVDPSSLAWFNPSAKRSLEINRGLLSEVSLAQLKTLKTSLVFRRCLFVHGFPPDSVTTYLFEASDMELRKTLHSMVQEICFVGHTHQMRLISFDGRTIRSTRLGEGVIHLPPENRYLINAGSVGQPRDGDRCAKYLIWDGDTRLLEVRFVAYDVAKTVEGILLLGLPRINAERLL